MERLREMPGTLEELLTLEREIEREWWWLNGALHAVAELQAESAKRVELEAQLATLGYGAPKRRGRPRKNVLASANGRMQTRRRMGKVKAKYRDPKTSETWSGRGRMASWLKA